MKFCSLFQKKLYLNKKQSIIKKFIKKKFKANNIFKSKNKKTANETQLDTITARIENELVKVEVKHFRRKLLKKICLFAVIFGVFLTLILIRDIHSMPVEKKYEEKNSTFIFINNSLTKN